MCDINYTLPEGMPPSYATAWGQDQWGIWYEFSIKGIRQRMRWIHPGTFLMGSPDEEPERYEEIEYQHKVQLTQGFWLADTTCTQELWKAVMSDNPSKNKEHNNNPVENVSWNDCQEFFKKVKKEIPALILQFPSEAQWEYACRAGTTTPFSFGSTITSDQVNFNGNIPYNKGEKSEYREKTVPVKSLPCNQWGLYEMHGNVWEWCHDWFAEDYYKQSPLCDPSGPVDGDDRVLRGGCFWSLGWRCRSAYRLRWGPVSRDVDTGLRCAQGQLNRS